MRARPSNAEYNMRACPSHNVICVRASIYAHAYNTVHDVRRRRLRWTHTHTKCMQTYHQMDAHEPFRRVECCVYMGDAGVSRDKSFCCRGQAGSTASHFRAKRGQLQMFQGLLLIRQDQNRALNVLSVSYSLGSGGGWTSFETLTTENPRYFKIRSVRFSYLVAPIPKLEFTLDAAQGLI